MNTVIEPLGNYVLIRRKKVKEMSEGGIVLPGASKQKAIQGVVVGAGRGKMYESGRGVMQVALGDVVVFEGYSGDDVTIDGVEYVLLEEDRIRAILR